MNIRFFLKTWTVYFLLAFPGFYFVYKYGTPDFGLRDFYDYYHLYNNWDISNVEAPFNMRLLSSFFVYLMNKLGLHYDTNVAFDATGLSRQVFFNAVFFNYLCVVTTCAVIFHTIKKFANDLLLSFSGGLTYLLGFGTLFFVLMPITDAMSILLLAGAFYGYLQKKLWAALLLLLSIMQREYILMAVGLLALLDFWKYREKYYLQILIVCMISFVIYYVLRKTLFFTPKYDNQASPGYFMKMLTELQFPLIPYIKQTLMTMNLFILYLFIVGYKKIKGFAFDGFGLVKLLLLFVQINLITFAAGFGNNTGRYFYMLIPIVIYYLIIEAMPLLQKDPNKI